LKIYKTNQVKIESVGGGRTFIMVNVFVMVTVY